MTESNESSTDRDRRSHTKLKLDGSRMISIGTLGTIGLSCMIGIIAGVLGIKVLESGQETLSTMQLVSLLFGIVLSVSSAFLAFVAISLGRASERAMVMRSDESIRLQNDVFSRTLEVLGRIESSTGVTERRIEDLHEGVSASTNLLMERLLEDRSIEPESREELERNVRESIIGGFQIRDRSLLEADRFQESEQSDERAKRIERVRQFREYERSLLLGLANMPGMTAIKIGTGHYLKEGDDLADGIFRTNGRRIGVFAFSAATEHRDWLAKFFWDLAKEIALGTFSDVLLVLDEELEPDSEFITVFKHFIGAAVMFEPQMHLFAGSHDTVLASISETLELG